MRDGDEKGRMWEERMLEERHGCTGFFALCGQNDGPVLQAAYRGEGVCPPRFQKGRLGAKLLPRPGEDVEVFADFFSPLVQQKQEGMRLARVVPFSWIKDAVMRAIHQVDGAFVDQRFPNDSKVRMEMVNGVRHGLWAACHERMRMPRRGA